MFQQQMLDSVANQISLSLSKRNERVVLAESCTAGMLAATLGQVPGISNHLCGSVVAYRAGPKQRWLKVEKGSIKKFTAESHEVARQMAVGVLNITPEADWGVAVVGHLGPDAPADKDGVVYMCFARRTRRGRIKIKDTGEHYLRAAGRNQRLVEATEAVLTQFGRLLLKKSACEDHAGQREAI